MDKLTVETVVKYFNERLIFHGISPKKIILFGSSASGNLYKGSDIDVAVVSDDFENVDLFERALLTTKAERDTMRKYDYPLDVIKLTVDEFENDLRMISRFVKKGKLIIH